MTSHLLRTASAVLVLAGLSSAAWGQLETEGQGKQISLVVTGFDADNQQRYRLFLERCAKCHSLERPISALRSGVTPVSGDNFDEEGIKKYVLKMMRKPNSGIDKSDARELVLFLRYARAKAVEP